MARISNCVPTLETNDRITAVVSALGSELHVLGAPSRCDDAIPVGIGPPLRQSRLIPVFGATAGVTAGNPRPLFSAPAAAPPILSQRDPEQGRGSATRLFACGLGALLLLTVTAYLYGVQQRGTVAESPLAWPVDDRQAEAIARTDVDPVAPANDPATQSLPTPSIEPAELARLINEEVRAVGIESVHVQVDNAYVATLRGIVASRHEHDALVGFVESIGEIAGVRDQLQVRRPASVRPDESRARPAVLPGPVIRAEAPRESQYLEPDRLVSDINRALTHGGFDGVQAEVDQRGQVTLRGTVRGTGQKIRAFELARSIGRTESVRDLVFVVEE